MGTLRTDISEIVTGLALFGFRDLDRALAVGAINAEEREMLETELTSRVRASSPAVFRKPAQ